MSIASEITSIGENLKKDYQAIANLGADLTNVDKNIENIAELLGGVYNNYPKTEYQEGTEINLGVTSKGKLDYDNDVVGIGQTEQDGTPTPSTPINIQCVTGNQDVVVSGKNLVSFPYYDSDVQDRNGVDWSVNENGTINASGTANSSSSIFYLANGDSDIYLEPGTYKISTNLFTDANGFSIQAIQMVNGSYGTVYWNDMVLTETTRLRIRIIAKPNTTVNVQNAYLMIERGNQATAYEKYKTPKTYQFSLGDHKFYGIGTYRDYILRTTGKNLAHIELEGKYREFRYGSIQTNESFNGYIASVKPNTSYIANGNGLSGNPGRVSNLCFFDNEMTYISGLAYNDVATKTFTTPNNCYYVTLAVYNQITNFQIEKGSTASDYQPFGVGDWYKFEKIGFYKITGQETIWEDSQQDRFAFNNLVDILHLQARQQIYCNRFQYVSSGSADYGMFAYWNGAITQVFIYDKDYTDPDDLKNYFANNETYFCYIRNTPVYTPITGTLAEQLEEWWNGQTLNGTTIITSNGNLPMIIKVRGLKGE